MFFISSCKFIKLNFPKLLERRVIEAFVITAIKYLFLYLFNAFINNLISTIKLLISSHRSFCRTFMLWLRFCSQIHSWLDWNSFQKIDSTSSIWLQHLILYSFIFFFFKWIFECFKLRENRCWCLSFKISHLTEFFLQFLYLHLLVFVIK